MSTERAILIADRGDGLCLFCMNPGDEELDQAVRRIISHAVAPQGVIDIFAAAGLENWTLRVNVRANLRRLVRRVLRKHGYPPDKQEKATRTVLEQAEALSAGWAA